jgi:hypothetical protein
MDVNGFSLIKPPDSRLFLLSATIKVMYFQANKKEPRAYIETPQIEIQLF